jgi:aspartate-semialdehyde dehydrogenase
MKKAYNVGIVGATGAVGQELIRLLEMRDFPMAEVRLLASARSAGKTVEAFGKKLTVQEAKSGAFAGLDLAFFAAGGSVTRAFAKDAVASGCVVIDKSSALRMEPDIPLVVPEINADQLARHKGIIANPNCSTAVTLMGLWPLHQAFTAKRVIISTFQSVSGTGAEAIRELAQQVKALQTGAPLVKKVYPYQIAFNCIPQVDTFGPDLYTGEENKMMLESRKIMGLPELRVSATCVRVPVVQAHSISVSAEFEKPVDVAQARAAVAAFPGASSSTIRRTASIRRRGFHPQGEVRRGPHPQGHGVRQRPIVLGERRQPLDGRRPQRHPGGRGRSSLATSFACRPPERVCRPAFPWRRLAKALPPPGSSAFSRRFQPDG